MPREMKESGVDWIGEIPTSWTTSKLKYIGTYINGYLFKSSMFSKSGKRVLRLQDLSKSYHNPQYFSGTVDTKFMASKGDILVSWNATLDAFVYQMHDCLSQICGVCRCSYLIVDNRNVFAFAAQTDHRLYKIISELAV